MLLALSLFACSLVEGGPAWSATATFVPDDGCSTAGAALPGHPAPPPSRLCQVLDAAEAGPAPAGPRLGLSFDCGTLRGRAAGTTALRAAQSGMYTVGDLAVLRSDGVALIPSREGAAGQARHELATCLEHGCDEVSGVGVLDGAREAARARGRVLRAEGWVVVVQPGQHTACESVAVFPDVPVRL